MADIDAIRPAKTIEDATNSLAFGALQPGDPRWVDLSEGRGSDAAAPLQRLLQRTPPDCFVRAVFVSHRGAGKTTELFQLIAQLENARENPYACIYFEANTELDPNRFTTEDLLLVMARQIEAYLRESLNTTLPDEHLREIEDWFASRVVEKVIGKQFVGEVRTEAEAKGGVPFLARLFGRVAAILKTESEYREKIERELQKYPGALTEAVNAFLDAVRAKLAVDGRRLLILIDNMDRYNPAVIDPILTNNADRFAELHANFIFTPPISLIYIPQTQSLDNLYRVFELPTVRLRDKVQDADNYAALRSPGKELLEEVVAKRIDPDVFFPDRAVLERAVAASGGAVRELLRILHAATLEIDEPPITREAVEKVLSDIRRRFRDRANLNGWWDALVRIAETKQLPSDAREVCHQILYLRMAFQYNGEGWYDIHPLVSEIPEFRARLSSGATW